MMSRGASCHADREGRVVGSGEYAQYDGETEYRRLRELSSSPALPSPSPPPQSGFRHDRPRSRRFGLINPSLGLREGAGINCPVQLDLNPSSTLHGS